MPIIKTYFIPLSFSQPLQFSNADKQKSLKIKILANLETWLNSTTATCQPISTEYQATLDTSDPSNKTIIFNKIATKQAHVSPKKRAALEALKMLATVLIIPRLVAELVRFGLRSSLTFKPLIETATIQKVEKPQTTTTTRPMIFDDDAMKTELQKVSHQLYSFQENKEFTLLKNKENGLFSFTLQKFPGMVFSGVSHEQHSSLKTLDAITLRRDMQKLSDIVRKRKSITEGLNLNSYYHIQGTSPKYLRIEVDGKNMAYIANKELPAPCSVNESIQLWKEKETELLPAFLDLAKLNTSTGFAQIDPDHFRPCCIDGNWSLLPMDGIRPRDKMENSSRPLEEMINRLHLRESMEAVIAVARDEWKPQLTNIMNQRLQNLVNQ